MEAWDMGIPVQFIVFLVPFSAFDAKAPGPKG